MFMRLVLILVLGLLAGCNSSKPLALVDPADPVWTLPLDHIGPAEMPQ